MIANHTPPAEDYLMDMAHEDFAIVYDKIKIWKIAPWIVRGGLVMMMVFAGVFIFANGPDMIALIFIGGFLVVAWAMSEWAMRTFMRRVTADVEGRQKRVVQGELVQRYMHKSGGRRSTPQGMWVIGEEHFRMDSKDYRCADKGDFVRMEMLPTAKIMIKVEVLERN